MIIESQRCIKLTCEEICKMLMEIKRRHPELTNEEIALKTGRSVAWIEAHLEDKEYNIKGCEENGN